MAKLVTFAKCSKHLLSTVIVGYESVGNLNKIQAVCQLLMNMKNQELKQPVISHGGW